MFAKIILRLYSKKMEPGSDKFSRDPNHQQQVSKLAEIARTVVSDGVDTHSLQKWQEEWQTSKYSTLSVMAQSPIEDLKQYLFKIEINRDASNNWTYSLTTLISKSGKEVNKIDFSENGSWVQGSNNPESNIFHGIFGDELDSVVRVVSQLEPIYTYKELDAQAEKQAKNNKSE